jgi:hypothetical protein
MCQPNSTVAKATARNTTPTSQPGGTNRLAMSLAPHRDFIFGAIQPASSLFPSLQESHERFTFFCRDLIQKTFYLSRAGKPDAFLFYLD